MTILIVDDNSSVRRLIRCAVAEVANEIWECDDGDKALASYSAHHPSVVLMDIRMPRMDGLRTTRQIMESHPSARVVIVTEYDDEAMREAAEDAGACGYALKLNLLDLVGLIRSVTDEPE